MSTSDAERLGQIIESYRLLSVLGRGSTSVVYLGQRVQEPHGLVAVKVLTHDAALPTNDRANFRARFLREAHAASKLRHAHILPVLSVGDTDELSYMVLPVVVGGTLSARLADQERPLLLPDIASYLTQLASALDYAHQQGLVHRDVKPSNVLLDEHGHLYLTDFGIARLFESGANALTREGQGTLTRTGQVLGTPYYMAPEQIKGEPVGPATDIYALGVTLYQLVTGQVPFQGDTPLAVAMQHLQEAPQAPSLMRDDVPEPVERVILRALAKRPSDRFPSAGALARAFDNAVGVGSVSGAREAAGETRPSSTLLGARTPPAMGAVHDTPSLSLRSAALIDALIGSRVGTYQIEQMIESSEMGAVFVARRSGANTPYRLRMLAVQPDLPAEEQSAYLPRFEREAQELMALQHPHILPVLDYGNYRGMPYLVTAYVTGQPLGAILQQSGPQELPHIGSYLDQIASALEYAHAHGTLHLNLTADCVYVRDDGDIAVADFAIRRWLEQSGSDMQEPPLYVNSEACSPEQLLGKPVGEYTDVYALGALLYQLVTGHQVFTGSTRDDVAQQHLYSTVPPLRTWRASLPAGLENILARALAKEPELRFRRPGELAAAYTQLLAQTSEERPFVVAPARTYPSRGDGGASRAGSSYNVSRPTPSASSGPWPPEGHPTGSGVATGQQIGLPSVASSGQTAMVTGGAPPPPPPQVGMAPPAYPPARRKALLASTGWRVALAAVLLIVGTGGAALAWNAAHPRPSHPIPPLQSARDFALVTFFDSRNGDGHTDALTITATNLPAPPAGAQYDAWLIDTKGEHVLALGTLALRNGHYTADYGGNGSAGQPGANLLSVGDKVEVTVEQGPVQAPVGQVVLTGTFPPGAFMHIQHLLVAFPDTPKQQGFLVGLLQQTRLLNTQAQVLHGFVDTYRYISARCVAQSIVDIIEGSKGANYQPLSPDCTSRNVVETGDGYGLLGNGYLAGASDHASLAAHAPDASAHIRMHAMHVAYAVTNVTGWLTIVDHDALGMLSPGFDLSKVPEIAALTDQALHGVDTNGDEQIDPVIGEAGVITAYTHGQLLAALTLTPGTK